MTFARALPRRGWALLGLLYAAASWATWVTRTHWVSDSRLYLAWSYVYLGHSRADAIARTHALLWNMPGVGPGCSFCWTSESRLYFFGPTYGATVGPRALYPLLSAPFVGLFGGWGMLVVPFLAFTATVVVLVVFTSRLYGPRWALVAGAALVLSTTVSRWSLMAMAEAPAMLVTTAILLVLPLRRETRRRDVTWFVVLLELGLFTRQYCEVIPAAVALAWLLVAVRDRRLRNPWLPFAVAGVVAGGLTVWLQGVIASALFGGPFSAVRAFEIAVHNDVGGRVRDALPKIVSLLARGDYSALRWDVLVLVVLAVALVGVVARFRSELSALAVGMFVATYALNVLIVLPTAFRYASPQYAYFLLAAVALLADVTARRSLTRSTESPTRPPTPPGRQQVPYGPWLAVAALWLLMLWILGHRSGQWTAAPWYVLTWHLVAATLALAATTLTAHRLLGHGPALTPRRLDHLAPALLTTTLFALCPVIVVTAVVATPSATVLLLSATALLTTTTTTGLTATGHTVVPTGAVSAASSRDRRRATLSPAAWLRPPGAPPLAGKGHPLGRLVGAWPQVVFGVLVALALLEDRAGLGLVAGALVAWAATALAVLASRRVASRAGVEADSGSLVRNPWLSFAVTGLAGGAAGIALGIASGMGVGAPWRLAGHGGWPAGWDGFAAMVGVDFRSMVQDRVLLAVLVVAAVAAVMVAVAIGAGLARAKSPRPGAGEAGAAGRAGVVRGAGVVEGIGLAGVAGFAVGAFAVGVGVQWVDGSAGFADFLGVFPAAVVLVAGVVWAEVAGWGVGEGGVVEREVLVPVR